MRTNVFDFVDGIQRTSNREVFGSAWSTYEISYELHHCFILQYSLYCSRGNIMTSKHNWVNKNTLTILLNIHTLNATSNSGSNLLLDFIVKINLFSGWLANCATRTDPQQFEWSRDVSCSKCACLPYRWYHFVQQKNHVMREPHLLVYTQEFSKISQVN